MAKPPIPHAIGENMFKPKGNFGKWLLFASLIGAAFLAFKYREKIKEKLLEYAK